MKKYKPLVLNITVFNVKTDEVVRNIKRTIDSEDRRKWLAGFIVWATLNGHYVECINQSDEVEDD